MNGFQAILQQQAMQYQETIGRLAHSLDRWSEGSLAGGRGNARVELPEFGGGIAENVIDWLFVCQQRLDMAGMNNDRRVLAGSGYLRGAALQWFKRRFAEGTMSWSEFKEKIARAFLPENHQEIVRAKLYSLRQTKTYEEYVSEFLALINQVEEMAEPDKVYQFIRGLGPSTSRQVGYERPKTLEEAIRIASAYETNFFPKKFQVARSVEMMDIGLVGEIECFRCRKKGHIARDCRVPKFLPGSGPVWPRKRWDPSVEGKRIGRGNQVSGPTEGNREVHQRAYLASNSNLPEINGEIHGYSVRIVVDSGASFSIMSRTVAEKMGLRIKKCGTKIRTADGEVAGVFGITEEVIVRVGDEDSKMEFLVTNLGGVDELLGWDWIKRKNAVLHPQDGKLVFTKELKLNEKKVELSAEGYMAVNEEEEEFRHGNSIQKGDS